LLAAGTLFAQAPVAKTGSSLKSGAKSTSHHKSSRRSTSAKSATPKPAAVTASNKTAPPATTAHPASTAHRASKTGGSKSGKKKPAVAVARRSNQQQPTPDRFREIQQALAEKGYFAGQPDGNWGPESVDALKRFQREQNLTEDGKLGALSLIALGLGPRRPAAPDVAVEAAPPEKQLDKPAH
jgi:peptidoglycan hydrolase-like protein with peptidoglycan-binding domain